MIPIESSPDYVLDHCARMLARRNTDPRSAFLGQGAEQEYARYSEAWRLPLIDRYQEAGNNLVTFVYAATSTNAEVWLICTATGLDQPIAMKRLEQTIWYAISAVVPHGQVAYYRFLVNGNDILDPINPQQSRRPDGSVWSRFFTDYCNCRLTFEGWEWSLVDRLTDHILPFRTPRAKQWLDEELPNAFRLDRSVGVVNYIDKILAREESHRLQDYQLALNVIKNLFRARFPAIEAKHLNVSAYEQLYDDMAGYKPGTQVAQWNHALYEDPGAFLGLLRRHTWTGAFCHPAHGGNTEAMGWKFLADRFTDANGNTLFDWARSVEQPLGRDTLYRG